MRHTPVSQRTLTANQHLYALLTRQAATMRRRFAPISLGEYEKHLAEFLGSNPLFADSIVLCHLDADEEAPAFLSANGKSEVDSARFNGSENQDCLVIALGESDGLGLVAVLTDSSTYQYNSVLSPASAQLMGFISETRPAMSRQELAATLAVLSMEGDACAQAILRPEGAVVFDSILSQNLTLPEYVREYLHLWD